MHRTAIRLGLMLALAPCLVALPACQRDEGPPGPGLNLPADRDLIRQSTSNLKAIGGALLKSQSQFSAFPSGFFGPDGKTLGLSWRVAILPNLGQDALYKEFKLEEAWDSEHNKALIPKMPAVFAAPETESRAGQTYYCTFSGPDAFRRPAVGSGKAGALAFGRRYIFDITDGGSNTIMLAEAAQPVTWTKPEDIPFDKEKPVPEMGGVFRKVTNVVLADGSLNYIKRDTPPHIVKAFITPTGGENGFKLPE
jgi:Protein of unknown function (DUF1559)